ncbi:hypothetical protein BS17DRAFT_714383 [Gyrodon lividus]|nr:hypothetical protein BS17DRAFT_714383 [Gyrodon lividus]
MPHKRAKRSVREQGKALRDTDLAPKTAIEHEPIPKSVSRVLDAGRIRREYREKQRKLDGDNDEDNPRRKKRRHDEADVTDGATKALKIKLGETVAHFNKRVENTMMPLIKTALQQSSAQARKVWKEEAAQEAEKRDKKRNKSHQQHSETFKETSVPPPTVCADEDSAKPWNTAYTAKEFQVASTSAPRRLNDIAQEPPEIKKIPRGATKGDRTSGVLSMAQRAMMDEERERAIRHYRELKARKLRVGNGVKPGRVDGNNTEAPS